MHILSRQITDILKDRGNPEKARWLENYVKHDIRSLGVGIPDIRAVMRSSEEVQLLTRQDLTAQVLFLDDLMRQEYTEPKLAAILYVQLFWKTDHPAAILEMTSRWLDEEWIADWNVCDWLCVRLLSPILDREPDLALQAFRQWNESPKLWKARASLVPFAQAGSLPDHAAVMADLATELIKREERFCKTAVGWVLREYSRVDPDFVTRFLEQHDNWVTKEVARNATKYLGKK